MPATRILLGSLLATFLVHQPRAEAAFPTTALKAVCLQQIHSPTTITNAGDGSGRLFVCDQPGRILIIQDGMLLPTPFLDISATAAVVANRKVIGVNTNYAERGLLGLTFHPGYANPASPGYRKFYLNYNKTYQAGSDPAPLSPGTPADNVSVIAEFQVSASDPNVADPTSERRLLLYTQPQSNHNGGQVEFGPEIGPGGARYLYIGVGDGGSQMDNNLGHTGGAATNPRPTDNLGNGQDKTRLFGKILRIDPLGTNGPGGQYGIPVNNPFVGAGGGVREEIYCYGMRNPWRFSFDKRPGGTNRLFCGDVGGDRVEEVDIIVSGGNYGWRYKEGLEFPTFSSAAPTNPMTLPPAEVAAMIDPIAVYAHSNLPVSDPTPLPRLGLSITGGFIYRGSAIPALQGKYVFGDYGTTAGLSDGRMMGLEETSPLSGTFTLTQAIPFINSSNPIVGQRVLCLGEDESGEIYLGLKTRAGVLQLDNGFPSGGIYKIVPVQSATTTLTSTKDNTIFSEDATSNPVKYTSDGIGYLFAGRTGSNFGPYNRRGLIAFDLSPLASGSVVTGAQVKLALDRPGPGAPGSMISLHRLNETWGEGTSSNPLGQGYGAPATANDATWTRRFYNTLSWTTPGGSYAGTSSASAAVGDPGPMTWGSTAQLVADVQGWINAPSSNAGWIVIGDEVNETTACRFHSKDSFGTPPSLEVTYAAPPALTNYESWLQTYFIVGQFVDASANPDGDENVNLLEYAYGFDPLFPQAPSTGLQVTASYALPNTVCTIKFRRDPRATDLSYYLESGNNLVGWTVITQSIAGGEPEGSAFVFEAPIAGEEPLSLVEAHEFLTTPAKHFVRLRVVRQP
jgi:glucose/arabinose dehydrogenase